MTYGEGIHPKRHIPCALSTKHSLQHCLPTSEHNRIHTYTFGSVKTRSSFAKKFFLYNTQRKMDRENANRCAVRKDAVTETSTPEQSARPKLTLHPCFFQYDKQAVEEASTIAASALLVGKNPRRQGIYVCPKCNIQIAQKGKLVGHLLRHSGQYPYCCMVPQCGKKYRTLGVLQSHYKDHIERNELTAEIVSQVVEEHNMKPAVSGSLVSEDLSEYLLPIELSSLQMDLRGAEGHSMLEYFLDVPSALEDGAPSSTLESFDELDSVSLVSKMF